MSGDIHALSGAYAVDAVDDLERAQFERHLAGCASCRAEVDSLREAAAEISATSLHAPPAALRSRVLADISTVRPLPPLTAAAPARVRSARRRFPALVAAAAALIALGAVGATVIDQARDDGTSITATERVENAADAQEFVHELADGGTLTVVRSEQLNQAVVTTEGLPALDADQTYELWLDHDGEKVRAGTMDGDATRVLLDGDPAEATGAAITIEPAGGSDVPTGPSVAEVDFQQT